MIPVVYAADIGSIPGGNFGWARVDAIAGTTIVERGGGTKITDLIDAIAGDLDGRQRAVALGFECPLLVPVPLDSDSLGKARSGDGNRSWSAGPGAGVLATGLAQTAWILGELRKRCSSAAAYLDWDSFAYAGGGLFLWEAFVTGDAKAATHVDDALIAAHTFIEALPDPPTANGVTAGRPLSLVGAALMWSGWETDHAVLHTPCLVIKSEPAAPPDAQPGTKQSPLARTREPIDGKADRKADGRPMGARVAELAERIPAGCWTTYGDVAEFLGSGAMAVARCLATLPMPNAHRILNAKGKVAAGFAFPDSRTDNPRTLLEDEGIRFIGDRADPSQRWRP